MPGNSNLHDSSRNKQDEFYTNLQLVEDELKHYRAHFKGKRIAQLLRDDEDVNDITNQRGIYEYLLSGDERHLSIRRFSDKMARTAYERQGGKCPKGGKHFAIEEMQADHITPWAKGGKTVAENCQMLCADCNRRKSDV